MPYQNSPTHFSPQSSAGRPEQAKKTISVKILKKSPNLLSYDKRTGQRLQYFNVVGGNGCAIYKLKVYQVHRFNFVQLDRSYRFADCFEKPDGLWVVSCSTIGAVKGVNIDNNILVPDLPENQPPAGRKRTLVKALGSPDRSIIHAKIVKVSPVKYCREGSLAVRSLALKDESGVAKVALFSEMAERAYTANSTVEFTGLYQRKYQNHATQLALSRNATFQFLSNNAVPVEITEADEAYFQRDPDFNIPDDELLPLEIDSILDAATYMGCTTAGCRLKKLKDGTCPTCEGVDGTKTYYAKLSFIGKENFQREVTFFQADLERLFGQVTDSSQITADGLILRMVDQLPIFFSAKVTSNRLYNITKT